MKFLKKMKNWKILTAIFSCMLIVSVTICSSVLFPSNHVENATEISEDDASSEDSNETSTEKSDDTNSSSEEKEENEAGTSSNSTSGEVKATSTSSTQTAITYDEENDYLYYEDGEYPQDVPALKWTYNDISNDDFTMSYDEENNILTLDGTLTVSGGKFFYSQEMGFHSGEVYVLTLELLDGEVDDGSSVTICFATDVVSSENTQMNNYGGDRNYKDMNLGRYSYIQRSLTINDTSEEYGAYFRTYIYLDSTALASGFTFNNAKYRFTITYADLLETAYEDGEMSYAYDLDVDGETAVVYTNKYQVADAAAGTKFARIEVGGSVGWFAVEPIRWILTYGSTLPSEYVAVSEKVLSVGSYKSKSSANLTYSSLYSTTNQSSSANLSSGALAWSVSDSIVYDAFNTTASQTAVFSENLGNSGDENTTITAAGYRVASVTEIDALGGGYATESTEFCEFILSGGTSTTSSSVAYWTRDLAVELSSSSAYGRAFSFDGIYNQGVYVTNDGVISNATLTNSFGARFSMTTSLANICDDGDYLVEDFSLDGYLTGDYYSTVYFGDLVHTDGWEVGQTAVTIFELEWSDLTFNEDDSSYQPQIQVQHEGDVVGWSNDTIMRCNLLLNLNYTWIDSGCFKYFNTTKTTGTMTMVAYVTLTDVILTNSYFNVSCRVDYVNGGSVTIKKLDVLVI